MQQIDAEIDGTLDRGDEFGVVTPAIEHRDAYAAESQRGHLKFL